MMTVLVETYNEVAGLHCWPGAPETVCFLRNKHRHIFCIRCLFEVNHTDRELELYITQNAIEQYLYNKYPKGEYCVDFGGMSCEMIAIDLVKNLNCVYCEVLEDGKGGSIVRK
jgi:hypothetical protein